MLTAYSFSAPANIWKHVETEHFVISYNKRTQHLVDESARIAESTFHRLAMMYGTNNSRLMKKIRVVLHDDEDFSNGWADSYEMLVNVYCRKTGLAWRGEKNWLYNLLSHEIAHIISLRLTRIHHLFTFGIRNETEIKDAYGSFSTLFLDDRLPKWFIEATAQIGSELVNADYFDPEREMLLRDSYLHGRLLSLKEMNRFEGTSREYELVYNQGYSFMKFISQKLGIYSYNTLLTNIRTKGINNAFRVTYDNELSDLYREWISMLSNRYSAYSLVKGPDGRRKTAYINETASAMGGRFVIANYRHDYNRFDLFENWKRRRIIVDTDVENILKSDRITGDLYYLKQKLNPATGAFVSEIYKKKEGKRRGKRISRNARCLALDAYDNILFYTSYANGVTSIVRRNKDGKEDVWFETPSEWAVYSMSAIDSENIILSYGDGQKESACFANSTGCRILWTNIEADIMDVISVNDKLVFSSTLDGTHQLYWAYFSNIYKWYRLTSVPGGARYPTAGVGNSESLLTYSQYTNGSFVFTRMPYPFRKTNNDINFTNFSPAPDRQDTAYYGVSVRHDPVGLNLWVSPPVLGVEFSGYHYREYVIEGDAKKDISMTPSFSWDFGSASDVFYFSQDVSLHAIFDAKKGLESIKYHPYLNIRLWQFDLFASVYLENYNRHYYYDLYGSGGEVIEDGYHMHNKFRDKNVFLGLGYEFGKYHNIFIHYGLFYFNFHSTSTLPGDWYFYSTGTSVMSTNFDKCVQEHSLIAEYDHYRSYSSKMDNGSLGQSHHKLELTGYVTKIKYNDEYFNWYYDSDNLNRMNIDTSMYFDLNAEWEQKFLSPGSHIAWYYHGQYRKIFDNSTPDEFLPYSFIYLGGYGRFSAYPYSFYPVREMIRGYTGLSISPFTHLTGKAASRMNLDIRFDYGYARYILGKDNWVNPQSLEFSYNFYFYMRKTRKSHLYFTYALPLKDLKNQPEYENTFIRNSDNTRIKHDKYQIYFGISF